jgi:hypothetical protein
MKPFIGNAFSHSGTVVQGRATTNLKLRNLRIVPLLNLLRIKRCRRYLDRGHQDAAFYAGMSVECTNTNIVTETHMYLWHMYRKHHLEAACPQSSYLVHQSTTSHSTELDHRQMLTHDTPKHLAESERTKGGESAG